MVVRRLVVRISLAVLGCAFGLCAVSEAAVQNPVRGQKPLRDPAPATQAQETKPAASQPGAVIQPVSEAKSSPTEDGGLEVAPVTVESAPATAEDGTKDPIIELAPPKEVAPVGTNRPADVNRASSGDRSTSGWRARPIREIQPGESQAESRHESAVEIDRIELSDESPVEIEIDERSGSQTDSADSIESETTGPSAEVAPPELVIETAPLTPELIDLRDSIRIVLDHYRERPEDVSRRSPWGIMHAMIAFEIESEVRFRGERVNALGWLCWNQPCAGQQLMYVQRGQLQTRNGPGVQGHDGQFLAMLAQCGVRPDNELRVNNRSFTVHDLVELEKRTCRPGTELTFKLIGLSYYLDSDEVWTASDGSQWNIARLIQEELKQPVIGAACGGTHRMMGFSFAVKQRRLEGKPIEGQWLRAQTFVEDFIDYTFQLQNPDGSFSTKWFEGRDARADAGRRIQTTGHILEWLVYSLEEDQLDDPRVLKATKYLTRLLWQSRGQRLEIGPQGHALHALFLYDKRRFRAPATAIVPAVEIER